MTTFDNSNDGVATSMPWHCLAVGFLTLAWSSYGIARYVATQFGLLDGAALTGLELAHFVALPLWVKAAWAVSAWGAFAGATLLLLRSKWAVQAFVMATAALVVTLVYLLGFSSEPVILSDMPIAFATWSVTLAATYYTIRVRSLDLLN